MSFVVGTATILKRDWKFIPFSYYVWLISVTHFKMDSQFIQLDQGCNLLSLNKNVLQHLLHFFFFNLTHLEAW